MTDYVKQLRDILREACFVAVGTGPATADGCNGPGLLAILLDARGA